MSAQDPERISTVHVAVYTLLCLIWGSTWLAIRITVEGIPPVRAAALRFACATAILAMPIALKRLPMPRYGEMRALLLLSVGMMALPYGLLFWAEKRIPSSTTAVLFAALPLLTSLFTPFLNERKVPRRAVYAMLVGTGGILIIFSSALSANAQTLMGGGAVLIAVASTAWASLYAKREVRDVHPVVSTAVQLGLGALFLLVIAVATERGEASHWTRGAWLALSFLTVFGSVIAFSVYYWLLREIQPYQIATISLVVPVIAIAEGALIGHERVPLSVIGAAALIIGSVASVLTTRGDDDATLSIASAAGEEHA